MTEITEKTVNILAGKADAACIIMHDIMMEMISGRWSVSDKTLKSVKDATECCEKLHNSLRAISFQPVAKDV